MVLDLVMMNPLLVSFEGSYADLFVVTLVTMLVLDMKLSFMMCRDVQFGVRPATVPVGDIFIGFLVIS